jgi:8-oxo-dGTP diphosphatase
MKTGLIKQINLNAINKTTFQQRHVSCIVLTHDHKFLLQQRGNNWHTFPGFVATFGGRIETGESPRQALLRELKEELGATIHPHEVVFLGAYTEAVTHHSELIYGYFWHDTKNSITGCYEGEAIYYDNIKAILASAKLMDDILWLINKCKKQNLL